MQKIVLRWASSDNFEEFKERVKTFFIACCHYNIRNVMKDSGGRKVMSFEVPNKIIPYVRENIDKLDGLYYAILPPAKGKYMDDVVKGKDFASENQRADDFKLNRIPLGPFPSELELATRKLMAPI